MYCTYVVRGYTYNNLLQDGRSVTNVIITFFTPHIIKVRDKGTVYIRQNLLVARGTSIINDAAFKKPLLLCRRNGEIFWIVDLSTRVSKISSEHVRKNQ